MAEEAYAEAARRIVEILGESAARDLLRLLEGNSKVRADTYRRLYERGGFDALLDVLTDIESDPTMRGWLAEYLRIALEGGGHQPND